MSGFLPLKCFYSLSVFIPFKVHGIGVILLYPGKYYEIIVKYWGIVAKYQLGLVIPSTFFPRPDHSKLFI